MQTCVLVVEPTLESKSCPNPLSPLFLEVISDTDLQERWLSGHWGEEERLRLIVTRDPECPRVGVNYSLPPGKGLAV